MAAKSRTAKYYAENPEARKKKAEYDTKLNRRPEQLAKRRELEKANREHDKKYGKESRRGKDLAHTASGMRYKDTSANRGDKNDTKGDRKARGKKK